MSAGFALHRTSFCVRSFCCRDSHFPLVSQGNHSGGLAKISAQPSSTGRWRENVGVTGQTPRRHTYRQTTHRVLPIYLVRGRRRQTLFRAHRKQATSEHNNCMCTYWLAVSFATPDISTLCPATTPPPLSKPFCITSHTDDGILLRALPGHDPRDDVDRLLRELWHGRARLQRPSGFRPLRRVLVVSFCVG